MPDNQSPGQLAQHWPLHKTHICHTSQEVLDVTDAHKTCRTLPQSTNEVVQCTHSNRRRGGCRGGCRGLLSRGCADRNLFGGHWRFTHRFGCSWRRRMSRGLAGSASESIHVAVYHKPGRHSTLPWQPFPAANTASVYHFHLIVPSHGFLYKEGGIIRWLVFWAQSTTKE